MIRTHNTLFNEKPHIPKHLDNGEILKEKYVKRLGTMIYYSRKGKTQFHEHLLTLICRKLENMHIQYERPAMHKGEDLKIGEWNIELEIRANPDKRPENRSDLLRRIARQPTRTIIVTLNTKDKQAYMHSKCRETLIENNRILTIEEFLKRAKKLQ